MSCAGPGASDLRVSFSSVRMSAPPVLRFVCVPVYSVLMFASPRRCRPS